MNASFFADPPLEDSIVWTRESDGALVAKIGTDGVDPVISGDDLRILRLRTGDTSIPGPPNAESVELSLTSDISGVTQSVIRLDVAQENRVLLDDLGRSHFLQLSSLLATHIVWGQVSSVGGITRNGSSDWTVARLAVGLYEVTVSPTVAVQAFIPTVTATATGVPILTLLSGTGFRVQMLSLAGAAADLGWTFAAIGRP